MKIIQTPSFIKMADHLIVHPPTKTPDDMGGSIAALNDDGDGINDIKQRWRRKKVPLTKVKLPYQKI